jgi:Tol biopolymer transport system component
MCVDAASDPANCGACAKTCNVASGEACASGVCTLNCGDGLTNCGGRCSATGTDDRNCGLCGKTCAPGARCAGGACTAVDVDECATNNGGCSPVATCTNTAGSFTCTCGPGFTGNGKQCAGTVLISVASDGQAAGGGVSSVGGISADGRWVVFTSAASNLVPNDTNGVIDAFLRDTRTGKTTRITTSAGGAQADGATSDVTISPDGRFAVFVSLATNLVATDTNGSWDVFTKDLGTGAVDLVSLDEAGAQRSHPESPYFPLVTSGGRHVVFSTRMPLAAADLNSEHDSYIRDRTAKTTKAISVSTAGAFGLDVAGACFNGGGATGTNAIAQSVSPDGRFVTFTSIGDGYVPDDNNACGDVFLRDVTMGTTARVSVSSAGGNGIGTTETAAAYFPKVSADGRFVVFDSSYTNLVANDINGQRDVFVRDMMTATTTRLSVSAAGAEGNGVSSAPTLSSDGKLALFLSTSSNLVATDPNGAAVDIFVRPLGATTVTRLIAAGPAATGYEYAFMAGGTDAVLFPSSVSLLAADANAVSDVYVVRMR